jgi:hypothetical protein
VAREPVQAVPAPQACPAWVTLLMQMMQLGLGEAVRQPRPKVPPVAVGLKAQRTGP